MIAPDLDAIPFFLTERPRWLLWREVTRKGKPTKEPRTSANRSASSTDPQTWAPFPTIAGVMRLLPKTFSGVGITLGDLGTGEHVCGFDLDSCLDEQGALAEWAQPIVATLPTYIEVSPSETGLKAFFRCRADDASALRGAFGIEADKWGCKRSVGVAANGKQHGPAIEVYLGGGRYFAVTGRHWATSPEDVALLDCDTLLQVAALVQAKTSAKASKANGKDRSRSAIAFARGAVLRREGKTFDEMCSALRADPETTDWVREKGEANGGRELQRIWERADATAAAHELGKFDLTEDRLALAFADRHRDALRYDHHAGAWFQWNGTVWRREETRLAFAWAREVCRQWSKDAGADPSGAAVVGKAATAAAVERYAQADRAFAVTSMIWDPAPFLLGTAGGTVDLHTGRLRPAMMSEFISKLTAVSPADTPDCPLWLQFLDDATQGDVALIRFLRQWCGYSLTGDTSEHALLFVYGPGGNGKGVFLNTLSGILNDYCRTAPMETFTTAWGERHPTELAMLRGARMVAASETEEGRTWAEVRIKQLTGGDMIAARFMRQDFFEYRPQFKLTFIGNHKPVLRNVDDAARRRFSVVPFVHKPPDPDRGLEKKLLAEWPAILRWMIDGCIDWQMHGLIRPSVVTLATNEYFREQDTIRQWIEDCCETTDRPPHVMDSFASLFASWRNYALKQGEEPGTTKRLSEALQRFDYMPIKDAPSLRGRGFRGLKVKVWQEPVDEPRERYP